jgi:hypothetical protein
MSKAKLNGSHDGKSASPSDGNVVRFPSRPKPSQPAGPALRALWTFLFSSLLGPAIAALLLALIYGVSAALGMGPPTLKLIKFADLPSYIAVKTLDAYIWSAIPAAVTGAILAAVVYLRGQFPWLLGVAVAAIAASAWAFASGGQAQGHVQFITAIAGLTAILGRLALITAKVAE